MNLYRDAGELLLGSRLKRIGERFLTEVARVYRTSDIDFDPAWFPVFFLLDREETVRISRFAEELQISQSGATQLIKGLEKKGLLEEVQAEGRDRRTKSVRFTDCGLDLLEEVRPVWQALAYSMESLLEEGTDSRSFLSALTELEDGFDSLPLGDRVIEELRRQDLLEELSLEPWCPEKDESYRGLLLEYLSRPGLPSITEVDAVLKNPDNTDKGIELFLLSASDSVIGFAVCRNLKEPELSALFISGKWRNCGVEKLFITLLEKNVGEPEVLTLILNQNQSSLLSAAKNLSFNLLCWEENLITLKRNQ